MRKLRPTSFDDVSVLLRAVLAGTDGGQHAQRLLDRKNGRKPVEYLHPDLDEALGDTYGLMVYQESMMAGWLRVLLATRSPKQTTFARRACPLARGC